MVWPLGILQALNQLFEKIMALDIDERHLLRLGHGEEELATDKDFSRWVCPVGVVILNTTHSSSVDVMTGIWCPIATLRGSLYS